jgi:hypothetical protein
MKPSNVLPRTLAGRKPPLTKAATLRERIKRKEKGGERRAGE